MLNLNSIAVDPQKAREGVWMDYMGGRFKVARMGAEYDARLVELYRENHELIKSDTQEGREKAVDIYRQCFAELVLLDWENVSFGDGPVEYTVELGLQLARNPLQVELIRKIEQFAAVHSNYQPAVEQEIAEDVKSSADS